MRNPFAPGVGGVLSADIAVPEHERELSFYSQILTTGSTPLWRDDLTNNRGTPVIGLGARSPEYEALPLQWMPHFQVLDVGASVARALELGGSELMHGKSEDGQSQWAVLVDPMGAAFGLIPVVVDESEAADQPESVGCISWLTLAVSDVSSTCEFYEQVVGWSTASAEVDGGFEMRRPDGVSAAAICHAGGDNEGIPPVWILSLPVDDLEESLRLVREGGGEIIKGSTDAGHAVVRDPVGVCIALQAKNESTHKAIWMTRVVGHGLSISLDGYMAGSEQSMEAPLGAGGDRLHDWALATKCMRQLHGMEGGEEGPDNEWARLSLEGVGATIIGRNMFGPVRGPWGDADWNGWWGDDPPFHHPVFVLTHHDRQPASMKGGTTFHFVTGGIHEALERAKEAAGDLDVRVAGGAATIQQFLEARLLDELHIAVVPILLGAGERLFSSGLSALPDAYECARSEGTRSAFHTLLVRRGP